MTAVYTSDEDQPSVHKVITLHQRATSHHLFACIPVPSCIHSTDRVVDQLGEIVSHELLFHASKLIVGCI